TAASLEQLLKDEPAEEKKRVAYLQQNTKAIIDLTDLLVLKLSKQRKQPNMLTLMHMRNEALQILAEEAHQLDSIEEHSGTIAARVKPPSLWAVFLREHIAMAVGLSALLSVTVGLLLSSSIVGRLKNLTDKAARLALLEAPTTSAGGRDEIATLDNVFNEM